MTLAGSSSFSKAFTLVEFLVVAGILAVLAVLVFSSLGLVTRRVEKSEMLSLMRSIGVGIDLYAMDHASTYPGPLWPGQVAEFDKVEDGRLVVRLAPYLGIEQRDSPYLVERFLPKASRQALPATRPGDIRVFVMNTTVRSESGTMNPWGTLTPATNAPLLTSSVSKRSALALSEAYSTHPAVAARPWKNETSPKPLYGANPLGLFFDGSVGFFNPAALP